MAAAGGTGSFFCAHAHAHVRARVRARARSCSLELGLSEGALDPSHRPVVA